MRGRRPTIGDRSCREEVLEIVRELPGIMFKDVVAMMPHHRTTTVSAMLTKLYQSGELNRELMPTSVQRWGKPAKSYAYTINPDPVPRVPEVKRKVPTSNALDERVRELEAKVQTLEAWKADAIARYPDLDVDPVVLEARAIVAAEIEAGGDKALATAVRAGTKDAILPMRVTLAALQRAA